jgi:hypothetical protein
MRRRFKVDDQNRSNLTKYKYLGLEKKNVFVPSYLQTAVMIYRIYLYNLDK